MFKKSINKGKSLGKILIIAIFISLAIILTSCTKKTTSPDEQLLAPSNLQITLVGDNQIKLTWNDNSTNETKFFIDRKEGVFDWFENCGEVEANITAFTNEIPTTSDTVYSYRVRAFDGENYSAYSDTVARFSVNSAPTNLQLEQIVQDSIKLVWNDNSIGEFNFRIDRKIGTQNWQENYKLLEPDTTSYIDYNPSLYDTCYYKVFAVCGNSYSDSTQNYFIPFLPAPSNLEIDTLSATSAKLLWQDNCEREDGYLIYKRLEGTDWNIINVPPNTEEWTYENVIPGIINYYKVCAYIDSNYSPYIEGEINTLPPPTNLQIEQQNVHTFKLDWDDNSNFEHGFKIDRKIDYEEWINEIGNVDSNITTWTDSTVGRNYEVVYYRVYAYYEDYNSTKIESNSNIVFPAPTNLQIEQLSICEIGLTWDDNSNGEEGFKIDRKIGNENWDISFGVIDANTEEWIDTEPVFDEINYYRVYAYAGENESPSIEGNINHVILAPTNLIATVVDEIKVRLEWGDNSTIEEGFKIERKLIGEDYELLTTVEHNVTTFTDITPDNMINYYRIYGYAQNFYSDYSNEVNASLKPVHNINQDLFYETIQVGIGDASGGDIVLLAPITYYENVNFNGKSITVGSLYLITDNTNYISQTIIDGNQNGRAVTFNHEEDYTSILNGITITNGYASLGGGILCYDSSPSLKNLNIIGNTASQGGGIWCNNDIIITNVTIIGNNSSYCGSGIEFQNCNSSLINVTISRNTTNDEDFGCGIFCYDSNVELLNCIIWDNSPREIRLMDATVSLTYSDIQGGWTGMGNINANPLFMSNDDFHLQIGSPCIDVGNPDPQYNDQDGTRNDMGAYGGPGGDW